MRYKYLRVHPSIFVNLLKAIKEPSNVKVIDKALPEDTEFVRVGYDMFGILYLTLESSEWPEVGEGDELQEIPSPIFEKVK